MELDNKVTPDMENTPVEVRSADAAAPVKKSGFLASRKFKYGTTATLVTVVFLVILILVNVAATLLLERYPLTIDLNSDKRFSLTQQSVDYLGELDMDVRIHICAEEAVFENSSEYYKQAYEVIRNYAKHTSRIQVDFVDLLSNSTFAQRYPEYTFNTGDIIVESELRSKKLASTDLFNIETGENGYYGYTQTVKSSRAEEAMTGAIMYVTEQEPLTVGLWQIDDTVDVSGYVSLLESNNYAVETISPLAAEIPSDYSFVILPQPGSDLTVGQVEALGRYLSNNEQFGRGMVFVAAGSRTVSGRLGKFLEDWGISVGPEVIVETDGTRISGDARMFLVNVADADVLEAMNSTGNMLLSVYSRPINVLFEQDGARSTKVLLNTNDTAMLLLETADENFDYMAQPRSAQNVAVLASRKASATSEGDDSFVLALGSELMLNSYYLQEGQLNNADFFITLTNGLSGKEENAITITPVNFDSHSIQVSQSQVMVYLVLLVILIPLAILATAFVVFLRRRHL